MRPLMLAILLYAGLATADAAPPAVGALPPVLQISYGNAPQQFGRLHLPAGKGPHPVVALLHGGCWQQSIASYEYLEPLAAALAAAGWATWSIEYLGTDEAGGGWPNSFRDVAMAIDHLRALAESQPLDLRRLVFAGHSAGGHLALWAASRKRLPRNSLLASATPLLPQRVLGLAAITDLERYARDNPECGAAVPGLIGHAELREVSPIQMLPAGAPVTLITAEDDLIVPSSQASAYATAAATAGTAIKRLSIPGDHFAVIEPEGAGLQALLSELKAVAPQR